MNWKESLYFKLLSGTRLDTVAYRDTERRSVVVSTTSYSGRPGFESDPRDCLPLATLVFLNIYTNAMISYILAATVLYDTHQFSIHFKTIYYRYGTCAVDKT
jgi:hypothetical protein